MVAAEWWAALAAEKDCPLDTWLIGCGCPSGPSLCPMLIPELAPFDVSMLLVLLETPAPELTTLRLGAAPGKFGPEVPPKGAPRSAAGFAAPPPAVSNPPPDTVVIC